MYKTKDKVSLIGFIKGKIVAPKSTEKNPNVHISPEFSEILFIAIEVDFLSNTIERPVIKKVKPKICAKITGIFLFFLKDY